jgi:hypothetical protein
MKYERLNEFLKRQTASEVPMTFADIEALIGSSLPASARKHRPWWSNNASNSVITHAWLDAGYKTERVDMGSERLVFRRSHGPRTTPAPAPAAPTHESTDVLAGLYGCMEGTIRFLPDIDLTAPTGEHWAAEEE